MKCCNQRIPRAYLVMHDIIMSNVIVDGPFPPPKVYMKIKMGSSFSYYNNLNYFNWQKYSVIQQTNSQLNISQWEEFVDQMLVCLLVD